MMERNGRRYSETQDLLHRFLTQPIEVSFVRMATWKNLTSSLVKQNMFSIWPVCRWDESKKGRRTNIEEWKEMDHWKFFYWRMFLRLTA
jgi:hypothetical protein